MQATHILYDTTLVDSHRLDPICANHPYSEYDLFSADVELTNCRPCLLKAKSCSEYNKRVCEQSIHTYQTSLRTNTTALGKLNEELEIINRKLEESNVVG